MAADDTKPLDGSITIDDISKSMSAAPPQPLETLPAFA